MGKVLTIYNVDVETRLRMRMLCASKGISMAQLLARMVDKEWNEDSTIADDKLRRVVRHLIKQCKP